MIRAYEPDDLPEFLRLCQQLHEEGSVKELDFSLSKMALFPLKEGLFLELGWSGNAASGMCAGWIDSTFFGEDHVAHMHLWYVEPEFRGGALGPILLKRFEGWAFDQGAKEIWVSQATGINSARTLELFEALGFEMVGFIARKAA